MVSWFCKLHIAVMLLLAFISTSSSQAPDLIDVELEYYAQQNKLAVEALLTEGCPLPRRIRTVARSLKELQLLQKKQLYEELTNQLFMCKKIRTEGKTTTTQPVSDAPTTKRLTTTVNPLPQQCKSAINLTEYWRKDHFGHQIKPISGDSNCDSRDMVDQGNPWFKFTGAAGSRLLNHCVPGYSCGSHRALWSDAPMPSQIGVVSQIPVYGSWVNNCYEWNVSALVVKCSSRPNDFVYKYNETHAANVCYNSFFGMD